MSKREKVSQRVILRVAPTDDGYYVIQKFGPGNHWTTYPFRYGQQSAAVHDMDLIIRGLVIKGFIAVVESEVKSEE